VACVEGNKLENVDMGNFGPDKAEILKHHAIIKELDNSDYRYQY